MSHSIPLVQEKELAGVLMKDRMQLWHGNSEVKDCKQIHEYRHGCHEITSSRWQLIPHNPAGADKRELMAQNACKSILNA